MSDNRFAREGFFSKFLATFFFAGYLPRAPGTWGSGLTLIILFFVWPPQWYYQVVAIAVVYLFGVWISGKAEEYLGHDARAIVIDEVAGQMTALFMAPAKFVPFMLGFALFRFFDIYKPPPANVWQRYRRGWGVMADDMASGIYAACVLQLILFFLDRWGVNYV